MGIDTPKVPQDSSENIESSKLEWGPELGEMYWEETQERVTKLNEGLAEEEKWRLPTTKELLAEFNKTGKTPAGFQSGFYLSGSAYHVGMESGSVVSNMNLRGRPGSRVRFVRDVA